MNLTQVDALWPIDGLNQTSSPFRGSGLYQFTGGDHEFLFQIDQPHSLPAQNQAFHYFKTGLEGDPEIMSPTHKTHAQGWDLIKEVFHQKLDNS